MTRTMSSTALLTVALVVTLVATVAGGAMAAWAVSQSIDRAGEIARREEHTAYLVSSIALDVARIRAQMVEALRDPGLSVVGDGRERIARARAQRDALPALLGADEIALWRTLGPRLERSLEHLDGVVTALEGGERERARMLLDRSAADSRRLFDELDEFRSVSQDETAVAVLAIQDRADWTLRAIGLVGGGFLVMSAFAWVLILRLVNSQRRALAERMQALEASNRELEAFAGRVAHDMRNVLSPIRLAADAIDASSTDPATRAIAERIGRSCLRGSDLVEALLTFSRAAGRADTAPQSAKLAKELADVLEQLEQQIRETGVLVLQRVPKSAYVAITPALLHVVLVNLIGNAVKFMQDCTDRRLTVYACEEGEHWRIDVSDTGPGIPESEIDHVFEALYRGAGARGSGVGLGLATVKRVVESHGGRVELRSSPGRGTTVTVCLPRAVSRVARANHEGAPTTPAISTS